MWSFRRWCPPHRPPIDWITEVMWDRRRKRKRRRMVRWVITTNFIKRSCPPRWWGWPQVFLPKILAFLHEETASLTVVVSHPRSTWSCSPSSSWLIDQARTRRIHQSWSVSCSQNLLTFLIAWAHFSILWPDSQISHPTEGNSPASRPAAVHPPTAVHCDCLCGDHWRHNHSHLQRAESGLSVCPWWVSFFYRFLRFSTNPSSLFNCSLFNGQANVDYANWLLFCLPATVASVLLCWLLMTRIYLR